VDVAREPSSTLRSLLEAVLGAARAELSRGVDAISGQEVLARQAAAVDFDSDPPGIPLSAQQVLALAGAIATSHHPGHNPLDLPITVESHGALDTVIATGASRRFRLTETGISPLCWIAGCDGAPLYDGATICWEHLEGLPAEQDADDAYCRFRVLMSLSTL
jgi:hypothetical protein